MSTSPGTHTAVASEPPRSTTPFSLSGRTPTLFNMRRASRAPTIIPRSAAITRQDLIASAERIYFRYLSPAGTVGSSGYRAITDVRSRAGGKAVDVTFDRPYPYWPELFSGLLPAHILKDAPGGWTAPMANGVPVSGGPYRVMGVDRVRGEVLRSPEGRPLFPTVHPSYLLRLPDPDAKAREYDRFVADLRAAYREVA